MPAVTVKNRTIIVKATLSMLCVAVLHSTTGQRHNVNSSILSNMKGQGRTLDLLAPLLGLNWNSYYQGPLNRPFNGLFGNIINRPFGDGYGIGASGSNYHYGAYPSYFNSYRPFAFGGLGLGSGSRPLFQQGINYSGAVGYRPPALPFSQQRPGYFGYNPTYNGIGSALNRPWNGFGSLTSGNSVDQPALTNTQAAQLGYALANRIKPFLIAAAGGSGSGVSSLTGRRRRGNTESNSLNELYGIRASGL